MKKIKRKNLSPKKNLEDEKSIQKNKKQPNNFKTFANSDIYDSDSQDSIQDSLTQFSNINRDKIKNSKLLQEKSESKNKKTFNKNSPNSSSKLKTSLNSSGLDLKKQLCDLKIIDVENHQQNPFINTRNKDLFNFREYDSYPVDHSAIKQIEFELRI